MFYRKFTIPPKAFALWVLLVPGVGSLGIVVGSWIVPLVVAIAHDGLGGVSRISREAFIFPTVPDWISSDRSSGTYKLVAVCMLFMTIPGAAIFGVLGERLYRFLIVKKLHWMTQQEVDAARKRERQLF
jgi:hypothetical protein